jgi:hypothetical protein
MMMLKTINKIKGSTKTTRKSQNTYKKQMRRIKSMSKMQIKPQEFTPAIVNTSCYQRTLLY